MMITVVLVFPSLLIVKNLKKKGFWVLTKGSLTKLVVGFKKYMGLWEYQSPLSAQNVSIIIHRELKGWRRRAEKNNGRL